MKLQKGQRVITPIKLEKGIFNHYGKIEDIKEDMCYIEGLKQPVCKSQIIINYY